MSILNEIAARTKERVEEEKFKVPLRVLNTQLDSEPARRADGKISFLDALKKPGMSYICEVKKASPSKGLIAPDFRIWTLPGIIKVQGHLPYPVSQNPFISRA